MDYKEKYNNALERAKKLYEKGTITESIGYIFPELAESEDEKIRKGIISALKFANHKGVYDKYIEWLEKQKVLTIEEDLQGKEDVLWCIKQAKKYAKDENEMGTCWFAEQWLEKQGEKPQGKSALEAIKEKPVDNANKVASAWNNGYSNGYIHAIEKACDWLKNHNDYIDVKDGNVTYFDMEKCVEDFRKAMKGGDE